MKKFYSIACLALILQLIPAGLFAQESLPTYVTGAPIRPGELSNDDRSQLEQAGIAVDKEKTDSHRSTVPGNAPTPFHASTARVNACPAAANMSTPYNTNNGQRGCMFDVYATNGVTVRCFESNLYAGTTANYEIYYRAGTHVGFENNAAAWTLLGAATGITSAGNNLPTALPIPVNVTIPAGQTYSFYITNDFGGGTSYTDGTAVGNFLAADANITVYEGVGKSYPFGLTFTVRNFNGTIFYDNATPLDAGDMDLTASASEVGVDLNWEIDAATQIGALSLQRSENGLGFSDIASWTGDNAPRHYRDQAGAADRYFYRLQLTDQNGGVSYSNVTEVGLSDLPGLELNAAYPNPFADELRLNLRSRQAGPVDILLLDQMGKVVHRENRSLPAGQEEFSLHLPQLPAGIYTLQLSGGGTSLVQKLIRQ